MTHPHTLSSLKRELIQRLRHNEDYLSRSLTARRMASQLSYGRQKSEEWLIGEEAAIKAENEWIRVLLAAPKPPAPAIQWEEMDVTVQNDAYGKREVRKRGEVVGRQG